MSIIAAMLVAMGGLVHLSGICGARTMGLVETR